MFLGLQLFAALFFMVMTTLVVLNVLRKKPRLHSYLLAIIWLGPVVLYIIAWAIQPLYSKLVLAPEDFVGTYRIDRDYFPGSNTD